METHDTELNLNDVIAALKRRSVLLISVASAIFITGVAIALLLPSIYRSQAVILIERQEIPADLVRSTITTYAEQRIQIISQRVMNTTNLSRIIEQFDLYPDERDGLPREALLEKVRSNIELEMISAGVVDPRSGKPTEATIAFSLAFEDENPIKAQRVTNDLVSSFLNENIKARAESATETAAFLDDEAENLRQRVSELEERIADFKDENEGNRPELEGLTRDLMNRTELRIDEIERRAHTAMQNKIYLEGQLLLHDTTLPPDAGYKGFSALEQARSLEAQLSAAEAAYGDEHPDVIRLRRQAEAIRATVDPDQARTMYEEELRVAQAQLNDLLKRYDATHPDAVKAQKKVANIQSRIDALPPPAESVPNNPSYVALQARLQSAIAELNSLEQTRQQLQEKLDGYAQSLVMMPDAEAEYRALNRDYETAMAKYREITAKQMEARISQNLESERKGEKLSLIEPPLEPAEPAKPNRPAILFVSFVLSVMAGLGVVGLVETMDDKIYDRRTVQEFFPAPPLAFVPVIQEDGDTGKLSKYALPAGGAVSLLIVGLLLVHVLVMPLDVLWYVLLRKAGL